MTAGRAEQPPQGQAAKSAGADIRADAGQVRCAVCNALLGLACAQEPREDCPHTQWLTAARVTEGDRASSPAALPDDLRQVREALQSAFADWEAALVALDRIAAAFQAAVTERDALSNLIADFADAEALSSAAARSTASAVWLVRGSLLRIRGGAGTGTHHSRDPR